LRAESQRFLAGGTISVLFFAVAFACFSARRSLRDLPAFLDMCCRGDLSAMAAPWLGAWLAPQARQYASCVLMTRARVRRASCSGTQRALRSKHGSHVLPSWTWLASAAGASSVCRNGCLIN